MKLLADKLHRQRFRKSTRGIFRFDRKLPQTDIFLHTLPSSSNVRQRSTWLDRSGRNWIPEATPRPSQLLSIRLPDELFSLSFSTLHPIPPIFDMHVLHISPLIHLSLLSSLLQAPCPPGHCPVAAACALVYRRLIKQAERLDSTLLFCFVLLYVDIVIVLGARLVQFIGNRHKSQRLQCKMVCHVPNPEKANPTKGYAIQYISGTWTSSLRSMQLLLFPETVDVK